MHFLTITLILLLGISSDSYAMLKDQEDKSQNRTMRKKVVSEDEVEKLVVELGKSSKVEEEANSLPSTPKSENGLPTEVLVHIFSFLEQKDLLRAGGTSKDWRKAATIAWETKNLDLSNRRLKIVDYTTLIHGSFSSLILRRVNLSEDGIRILSSCSQFKHLDFRHNKIGNEGAKVLANGKLSILTVLDLEDTDIGCEGAKELSKLSTLTTLNLSIGSISNESLNPRGIGNEGVIVLSEGNLSSLKSLYLNGIGIGENGAIAIAKLSTLTTLNLNFGSIGGVKGARALAMGNLSVLRSLHLKFHNIGDEGAAALSNGNLPSLTLLDLESNSIGNEGVKELSKLSTITNLNLKGNHFWGEGKQALSKIGLYPSEKDHGLYVYSNSPPILKEDLVEPTDGILTLPTVGIIPLLPLPPLSSQNTPLWSFFDH